jgi:hypothetical protein
MATKIQKIFAKFIRTNNPNERAALKHKLKGVKTSQVSYTKDGERYTIHGNIPWSKPGDKKRKQTKRRRKGRPKTKNATATPNYSQQTKPGRKWWRKATKDPPKRKYSDDPYWDGYAKTNTGK